MTVRPGPRFALLLLIAVTAGCQRTDTGAAPAVIDWQTSPLDLNLRGLIGSSRDFQCPAGRAAPHSVTGSGVYSDASSICAAAVHAGAIDAQRGGMVTIQILPGQPRYQGTTQNFVHSDGYAHSWGGSFAVLSGPDAQKHEPR
jgi:LCCL domain